MEGQSKVVEKDCGEQVFIVVHMGAPQVVFVVGLQEESLGIGKYLRLRSARLGHVKRTDIVERLPGGASFVLFG